MISHMRKNHISVAMMFLILATDVIESLAQMLMKMGLSEIGINNITLANLGEFAVKSAFSFYIWLGLLTFLLNFFVWVTILSRLDLSVALPVSSFSYIFVPIFATLVLHETMNPVRWLGTMLIITGIFFVAKSAKIETIPI